MNELHGRTAVVTGAAGGIGRALVERLGAEGMRVVVSDIDRKGVDAAVGAIGAAGGEAVGAVADVSTLAGVRALAEVALDAFGAVHLFCANAGVVAGGRVEELSEEQWRWLLDVDLWGPIHGMRVFLPLVEAQGEGHLLATASTSGLGAPILNAPYSVAKAGVIALMETIRRELDDRDSPVGASVLCPGPVATGLIEHSAAQAEAVGARSDTPDSRRFRETSGSLLAETGIGPAVVADLVVEAVRTNRFWILTHPEWADVMRRRTEAMVTTGALTGRAPDPQAG